MKNRVIGQFAILILVLSSALSLGAWAQTTDEGPGPSEQPSAPMEIGQGQGQDAPPMDGQDMDSNDAQPTEAAPGGPSGEAPARTDQGVARVSLIHGDISTQRGDSGDWSAAVLNQPVMTGDKVSTADNARTEVQLDFANVLRLGPNSKANVANLTQKNIQIQLSEGLAFYSVSKDSEAEPEIDTPNVSIHPSHHDGIFRVEVHPDGDTLVIVRQGEAQIATPQGSTEVRSGEMATIRGNAESAQYKISSAPDRDDWDRWNSDRDHIIRSASSWNHTNRYYTGSHDLDAYGHWRHVDDYGDVWYPDESSDWVPYRNGNWVWEPSYGWTWVGYEPWGWAPYHYGRWMYAGGAWGWWPGPVGGYYRPFWAPAYVSFWGWGGGWGFGVGFGGWGGFGWLPLGPCDWFHPWWGGYGGRFGSVNVTNVNITNINVNRFGGIQPLHNGMRYSNLANVRDTHIGRALSTVNAGRFGTAGVRPVGARPEQLRGARMMAGNLPVVPTRASLSASGRAAAPSTVRNGGPQRFFGTHSNMVRPASFTQQTSNLRQAMQQSHVGAIPAGGRSNAAFAARGTMQRPSAGIPANRETNNIGNRSSMNQGSMNQGSMNQGSTVSNQNRGGFRPFNAPNNPNRSPEPARGTTRAQQGGFRSFTPPSNSNRSTEPARGRVSQQPANSGFRPFNPPSASNRSAPASSSGFSRPEPQRGTSQAAPAENRGGFRPFNPPSRSEMSNGNSARGSSSGYWNRTAPSSPSSNASRGYSDAYSRGSAGASRPQLDMHQPVVRAPSYGGSNGGYRAAPSYGGSRGYPSYGGARSAPPSYGGGSRSAAPSYGGGGGGRAPSGGGGHYSGGGGGGGHAPSGGGGGGRSSGGGGGGHSSGGGSHGGHR
jgi:hypothetical protein